MNSLRVNIYNIATYRIICSGHGFIIKTTCEHFYQQAGMASLSRIDACGRTYTNVFTGLHTFQLIKHFAIARYASKIIPSLPKKSSISSPVHTMLKIST